MGIDNRNPDDAANDLASKVDALLARRGSGSGSGIASGTGAGVGTGIAPQHSTGAMLMSDDRNIPLLTDIIDAPSWHDPLAVPSRPPARTPGALGSLSDAELDLLAHDIFSRVFDRLDGPLASKIEDRLHERIGAQINAAVVNVLGDMRQEIANEIGDAVNAALADQLRNTHYRN